MRLKKQMREFAHRSQSNIDAMRGDFIKKHGYHRCSRMGLFTDYDSCSAAYCLVFDALPARRMSTDLSHAESCMHGRMPHDGTCLICVQTSTPRRGQKSIAQRQAKRRPGLRRSLGLQPAWVDRTMRYHRLFSPLRLTGMRRESHDFGLRRNPFGIRRPRGHQKE